MKLPSLVTILINRDPAAIDSATLDIAAHYAERRYSVQRGDATTALKDSASISDQLLSSSLFGDKTVLIYSSLTDRNKNQTLNLLSHLKSQPATDNKLVFTSSSLKKNSALISKIAALGIVDINFLPTPSISKNDIDRIIIELKKSNIDNNTCTSVRECLLSAPYQQGRTLLELFDLLTSKDDFSTDLVQQLLLTSDAFELDRLLIDLFSQNNGIDSLIAATSSSNPGVTKETIAPLLYRIFDLEASLQLRGGLPWTLRSSAGQFNTKDLLNRRLVEQALTTLTQTEKAARTDAPLTERRLERALLESARTKAKA